VNGEIEFEYATEAVIHAQRDGAQVATLVRRQGTWDVISKGETLNQGSRGNMKRWVIDHFCACEGCQKKRKTERNHK
jgi:hypothetical protein